MVLLLSTPLVAAFSYALGEYDARPWWEAVSGALMAAAGLCLFAAAAWPGRTRPAQQQPIDVAATS